jgi:hypothetical protein
MNPREKNRRTKNDQKENRGVDPDRAANEPPLEPIADSSFFSFRFGASTSQLHI